MTSIEVQDVLQELVTRIEEEAFYKCHNLERIKLPDSIVSFNDKSFYKCTSLRKLNFPKWLVNIVDMAFKGCISISYVNLPKGLVRIGDRAFEGCISLTSVNLESLSLQNIGNCAFHKCYSLIYAKLHPGIQNISNSAFRGCLTLELRQIITGYDTETSNRTVLWLKQRFQKPTRLPIHEICSNPNSTHSDLQEAIRKIKKIALLRQALSERDELGLTALHVLCLNPNATPNMFQLLVNAYPQVSTMETNMITKYEVVDKFSWNDIETSVVTICDKMTPVKLLLKMRGISFDKESDFNDQGQISIRRAMEIGLRTLNDILAITHIQLKELNKEEDEESNLCTFMQAAMIDGMSLELVYQLAMIQNVF